MYTYTYISDHDMPQKTIYVANDDQPVFDRAQELAGENLSAVIVRALREFVSKKDSQVKGMKEIMVQVGSKGLQREQRFRGRLALKWTAPSTDGKHWLTAQVYRTAKDNWAVALTRQPHPDFFSVRDFWKDADPSEYTAETTLIVVDDLANPGPELPTGLIHLMRDAASRDEAPVEYLDI